MTYGAYLILNASSVASGLTNFKMLGWVLNNP